MNWFPGARSAVASDISAEASTTAGHCGLKRTGKVAGRVSLWAPSEPKAHTGERAKTEVRAARRFAMLNIPPPKHNPPAISASLCQGRFETPQFPPVSNSPAEDTFGVIAGFKFPR